MYNYCNCHKSSMQGWERAIDTLTVRRPQPHNTNPCGESTEKVNRKTKKLKVVYGQEPPSGESTVAQCHMSPHRPSLHSSHFGT